ncbi:WD repeat domain phosphoinositide-interacting protein 2 [Lignoscripta atroalba]|nr:WD repeat domain phosphoinositide-interacting protein 2 [Lignoscripta atroalba]
MSMNFVTFNQDYSHLAVGQYLVDQGNSCGLTDISTGTSRGFRIYTTDPFSKCFETKEGDIAILEMLFSTSLVALILSPRRLQITNTKRQSTICELTFPTTVLAVRLNRKRLVVILEDQIYLYDISNMKLLYTIETSPNPNAICALSPSSENCYLAYPLPQKALPSTFAPPSHTPPGATHVPPTSGDVLLFDALKLEAINVAEAHRSPLSCITLNNTGTLLATASDKGTIIRVFGVPSAQKLYQFRRGSMPSRIYSMSFNATSSLLCVSSATETIHIFKLGGPPQRRVSADGPPSRHSSSPKIRDRSLSPGGSDSQPDVSYFSSNGADSASAAAARKHNGTLLGMIRRTSQNVGTSFAASVGAYLPSAVAEMWEPARDFAWCKIPKAPPSALQGPGGGGSMTSSSAPLRSVVAMSSNSPQIMVVTNEGHFYVFGIDLEKGGEGTLVKVYEIGGESERLGASIMDD